MWQWASTGPGSRCWAGAVAGGAGLNVASLLRAGVNVIPAGIFVLGASTLVSGWLLDTSVLHYIARAPAAPVQWDMAAILAGLGIAAAIAGAAVFARRDLAGA